MGSECHLLYNSVICHCRCAPQCAHFTRPARHHSRCKTAGQPAQPVTGLTHFSDVHEKCDLAAQAIHLLWLLSCSHGIKQFLVFFFYF